MSRLKIALEMKHLFRGHKYLRTSVDEILTNFSSSHFF